MGTRHLIAVQCDGEYKVAQYGQWDGYPSGQGVDVLAFCRSMDRDAFASKVRKARWISPEELTALWRDAGAKENGLIEYDKARAFSARRPELSRDTGADILGIVMNSPDGIQLKNSLSFAAESLFCEFAYVIDLDAGTLEVFRGFNKTPLSADERFASVPKPEDGADGYMPVKLMRKYRLDELPTKDKFLADLEPKEEDETEAA